jgi:predicted Zn finger-like uncharacterized protein
VIVRCPNCGTEFGFDDRQVGEGVTVRCSVCKHVFKVAAAAAPAAPAAWQIRTTDDTSFTASDVATLREWISEGRLTPDDQVSRTGRNWMRLGEMPEFADLFGRQEGGGGLPGVIKPIAPPVMPARPPAVAQPAAVAKAPAVAQPPALGKPVVAAAVASPTAHPPLPPATTAGSLVPRAVPPASESGMPGMPSSLLAGQPPQSQRLTMPPPRSAPVPSPAPSLPKASNQEDLDVLVDDEVEEDNQLDQLAAAEPVRRGPSAPTVAAAPERMPAAAPARAAATQPAGSSRPTRARAHEAHLRDDDDDDDRDDLDHDDDDDGDSDSRRMGQPAPDDSFEAAPRRGGLGAIAAIAVIAVIGVGVVFGVPSIRERVLGGATTDTPADSQPDQVVARPEIAAADLATNSLGTAALAQAEAGLQRAIDGGEADVPTKAALEVALAELLVNRALAYQIAAAIDEVRREDFRARATDDRQDGERLIDELEGFSDVERLAKVRALGRLAAGRAEVEVAPLVPDDASETKLIVRGAVLWQDLAASVPEGLVAGLQALPERSGLGHSVLALALLRAGDTTAARNTAERLMVGVGADEQVVAQAIRTRLGPEQAPVPEPEVADTGAAVEGDTAGVPVEGEEGGNVAKPPPPPGEDGGGGGGGGGGSFNSLLERGCEQVATGDADAGIKTLQKAFDKNPRDVDVLVCLADGYLAQGSTHHANTFYERALEQSPTNKGALRGAAKAAAKTGATQKALDLYERLLKVDPNNAVALAYVANNKPGGAEPPPEPEPEPAPAPEGGG